MKLFTLDLEGVLVPEIWIALAEKTGIEQLRRTTRDEPDYSKLMRYRMDILDERGISLADIRSVISELEPLDGAKEFYGWLKSVAPTVIISDTFEQFAGPLMEKLGYPTLFCNTLEVSPKGMISGYKLRCKDQKRLSVEAFRSIGYEVISSGDSYNDLPMLRAANKAALFKPTAKFAAENSDLPVAQNYAELKAIFEKFLNS